jgi:hypothetical protein
VPSAKPIEVAIAAALRAGQWAVVSRLAKELEARRLASSPNVVALDIGNRGAK